MHKHWKRLTIVLVALGALLFGFGLMDPFELGWFDGLGPRVAQLNSAPPTFLTATEEVPWSGLEDRVASLEQQNEELRSRVQQLSERHENLQSRLDIQFVQSLRKLDAHPFPDEFQFCGEALRLEDPDIRARFEAEINRFLVNQHWVIGWMRRSRDVFPFVEASLTEAGMPLDLRYVMVIESGLDPRATSSAGAAGYWQFTTATGRQFGLDRSRTRDERRDLYEATGAALRYLKQLYAEFESWPLALAAYNAGETRVRESIELQNTSDYFELMLPRETEAYLFKAAAVKLLFERREAFGLTLVDDGWSMTPCDTLLLKVSRDRYPIKDFLGDSGLTYRRFKELNPSFRRGYLTKGTHRLAIPQQFAASIHDAHPRADRIASPELAQPASPLPAAAADLR